MSAKRHIPQVPKFRFMVVLQPCFYHQACLRGPASFTGVTFSPGAVPEGCRGTVSHEVIRISLQWGRKERREGGNHLVPGPRACAEPGLPQGGSNPTEQQEQEESPSSPGSLGSRDSGSSRWLTGRQDAGHYSAANALSPPPPPHPQYLLTVQSLVQGCQESG